MKRTEIRKTLRAVATIVSLSLMTACVIPDIAEDAPYDKDVVGFAEVGKTTKEEVQNKLGPPSEKFARGEWWVFRANRQMTEWYFWLYVPGMFNDTADLGGKLRDYYLLLRFDDAGVLQQETVVHDNKPCDESGAVCYQDDQIQLVWNAETFSLDHPELCTVIVYGRTPAKRSPRVWLEIGRGEGPIGHLTDTNFLRAQLADGSHEMAISSSLVEEIRESFVVECAPGETHFLRLIYEGAESKSFAPVEAALGHEEIRERTLSLSRDWQ